MAQRWAFFSHAYNLGDCSRAIEVAKAMRAAGSEVAFFHHSGFHLEQIKRRCPAPIARALSGCAATLRDHRLRKSA